MDRLPEEFLPYRTPRHLSKKLKNNLIILGVWFLLTLILVTVSLATIRQNIRRYESMSAVSVDTGYMGDLAEEVDVFFISPSLLLQKYKFTFPSSGRSVYHTALNALLSGPASSVLKDGAITLINPYTELLGFTLSENTAFVNLTEDFLYSADFLSNDLLYPKKQIEMTLKNINPDIENVVYLVDGIIIDN